MAKVTGQEHVAVYTNQMGPSYDRINMNNRSSLNASAVVFHLGLDYPHPCVMTWGITNDDKPLNESTGVGDVMGGKR